MVIYAGQDAALTMTLLLTNELGRDGIILLSSEHNEADGEVSLNVR